MSKKKESSSRPLWKRQNLLDCDVGIPHQMNSSELGSLSYRCFSVSVCRKRCLCLFPPRTRHMLSSTVICVTIMDVIIKWQWCRLLPDDTALETSSYITATHIASSLVPNFTVYSCCNRSWTYKWFGRNQVLHCFCDIVPRAAYLSPDTLITWNTKYCNIGKWCILKWWG